jgi:homoserine kinase
VVGLALVPDNPVPTEAARSVLPEHVPHVDAATNSGRAALLVHALTRAPELLYEATADWLHQSYRAASMPDSAALLESLRDKGMPAVISGAGPTVLVLGREDLLAGVEALVPDGFRSVGVRIGGGVRLL